MFHVHSRIERSHIHSLPHYQHPIPEGYICYNWWIYIKISLSRKVHVYIRALSWYNTVYGSWQMYNDMYLLVSPRIILQTEISSMLQPFTIHLSPSSWQPLTFSPVFIVLPFLEYYIVKNHTARMVFSDWFS